MLPLILDAKQRVEDLIETLNKYGGNQDMGVQKQNNIKLHQ